MSINVVKSSPVHMTDELTQSNKVAKPQVELALKGSVSADASTADRNTVELQKIAELQKVGKQEEKLNSASDEKELEQEAEKVSEAMKTIAEFINMPVRTVNFTQDDGSEKTVIKIFDSENKELIKQFPSEEILSIAQKIVALREDVSKKTGILLDESI